ncbi:MAG: 50S ribosomal protein L13 [Firmicutes bacterium]|nr:50S ribosomal protein L13 [Bacillota bacterium]
MQKTFMARPEDIKRKWYVVDAEGRPLGRLASAVASVLKGKHRPEYTPHIDTGDHVIVVNAEKVRLTGRKLEDKVYYRHTMHPGGLRSVSAGQLMATRPEKLIRMAIWGMLPHNRLGRQMIRKLKVYKGSEHPHTAQRPTAFQQAE